MEITTGLFIGFLVVVAVVSAVIFRRRPLGTRSRTILSIIAVGMLGFGLVRDSGLSPGAVSLTLIAAVVLGYGVFVLSRADQEVPPRE